MKNKIKSYLKDLHVLFVDDEDGVRESYEKLLNIWVDTVYTASNGLEGLEIYQNKHLDVIITDIKMPIMSGLDMAAQIKTHNPDFPIIITTAHQEPELLLDAIEYHIDAYIVKPIAKKELKKHLNSIGKMLELEKSIEQIQRLNQLYLDTTSALIISYDMEGTITMINKEVTRLLGYSEDELVGKSLYTSNIIPQRSMSKVKRLFAFINKRLNKKLHSKLQQEILSKDGEEFMIAWSNVVMQEEGKNTGVLSSGMDITALYKALEEIKTQSYIDLLTRINNRKSYNERIEELLSLYNRYQIGFSFLIYDIDDFKQVNDNYGHKVGDAVLVEMSSLIESTIRRNDYLFRIGGEEFVILFTETTLEQAKIIAEKIRNSVEMELNTIEDKTITISIGLTEVNAADTSDSIFMRADNLLYDAKNRGKNRVESAK